MNNVFKTIEVKNEMLPQIYVDLRKLKCAKRKLFEALRINNNHTIAGRRNHGRNSPTNVNP